MAHRVVEGHEMAEPVEAAAGEAVHGVGSTDHDVPFQSTTAAPTTARQNVVVGHEIPVLAPWAGGLGGTARLWVAP